MYPAAMQVVGPVSTRRILRYCKNNSCRKEDTKFVSSGWTTKGSSTIITLAIANCAHWNEGCKTLTCDNGKKQRYKWTWITTMFENFRPDQRAGETKNEPQLFVFHTTQLSIQTKPENVRSVCNAASKYKSLALDDKLMSGPDLLQNLVGFFFRFGEHEIAITADVEAMFLQVTTSSL